MIDHCESYCPDSPIEDCILNPVGNVFVHDIQVQEYCGIRIMVIYNIFTFKFSAYIVNRKDAYWMSENADEIVQYCVPLEFSEAKKIFTTLHLSEENYCVK